MNDQEIITQLRIDVAVLKSRLFDSEKALKLAQSNLISYIGFSMVATGIIMTIILKFIKQ